MEMINYSLGLFLDTQILLNGILSFSSLCESYSKEEDTKLNINILLGKWMMTCDLFQMEGVKFRLKEI
jgi:hypothetical protein